MISIACACAALTMPMQRPMLSVERAAVSATPLSLQPARTCAPTMSDPWAATGGGGVDMNTVLGVVVALGGVFGGIGLIAFTENAGKRNEKLANVQSCVECKGEKVCPCQGRAALL